MRYVAAWTYGDGSARGVVPFKLDENAREFIEWYRHHFSMDPAIVLFREEGGDRSGLQSVEPRGIQPEKGKVEL